jgi:hypothetical protein
MCTALKTTCNCAAFTLPCSDLHFVIAESLSLRDDASHDDHSQLMMTSVELRLRLIVERLITCIRVSSAYSPDMYIPQATQ